MFVDDQNNIVVLSKGEGFIFYSYLLLLRRRRRPEIEWCLCRQRYVVTLPEVSYLVFVA